MQTLSNLRIFDGTKFINKSAVTFSNGCIVSLQNCSDGLNMSGAILAPGFIDIHMHGLLGQDAMYANGIEFMAIAEPRYGTTSLPGACADFVLLNDKLEVQATYVRGICEYCRDQQN